MSTRFRARAVIGYKLQRSDLYATEMVSHAQATGHVAGTGAYCSACGVKNTGETIERWRFGPTETIFAPFTLYWGDEGRYAFLGFHVATDYDEYDSPARKALGDVPMLQVWLQGLLEPLDLWRPEDFGLWAILEIL